MAPNAPRLPSHPRLGWRVTSRRRQQSCAVKATRCWLAPRSSKRQPAPSEPTGYEAPQRHQAVLSRAEPCSGMPPRSPAMSLDARRYAVQLRKRMLAARPDPASVRKQVRPLGHLRAPSRQRSAHVRDPGHPNKKGPLMSTTIRFTPDQVANILTKAALADDRLPRGAYSSHVAIHTDPAIQNITVTHVDVTLTLDTPAEQKNHNVN